MVAATATIAPDDSSYVPSKNILCVDLDGTLLASDMLWEALLVLLKRQPLTIILLPLWMLKGKAYFKRQIAARISLDPASLPYRENLLSFLQQERMSGRKIILATASDYQYAESISKHLNLFCGVLASDGKVNLSGHRKLDAIKQYAGGGEFDYIGNDAVDLPLWQLAGEALLVAPSRRLLNRTRRIAKVGRIFPGESNKLKTVLKAIRLQQWVKNILLFVPLLTSHRITDVSLLLDALYAFVAFSFCASGVYVINDLLDLESDRLHPRKKNRPFAAGSLSIRTGILMCVLLLICSFSVSVFLLPPMFSAALILYLTITTAYSYKLKRIATIDVMTLAGLYTLRVLAGGVAVGVTVSPWLLAFSIFFFLSLAFVKRYSELHLIEAHGQTASSGRGYAASDKELIRSIGPVSGYLSVLVLALYINSPEVRLLYQHPNLLWLVGLCLLYWINRVWFLAHQGKMEDDPIAFAVKDRCSYIVGVVVAAVIIVASL